MKYKCSIIAGAENNQLAKEIYDLLYSILERSKKEDIPPFKIAKIMAEEKIKLIGEIKKRFVKY